MAKSPSKRTASRMKAKARSKRAATSRKVPQHAPGAIEVIGRGCLVEGSCVLLCKNVKHGYLYLPGGHVEFQESAAAAVAREFLEECGLAVRVGDLALVSEGAFSTKKRPHHELNLVFLVERLKPARPSGRPAVIRSHEPEIAFEWVDLSAVVDFDIRPTAAKAWLATLAGPAREQVEWVSEMVTG